MTGLTGQPVLASDGCCVTYAPELIYSFKDKYELTEDLLYVFEQINELFKTSSQYIDMKKRINLNVKWKLKKKDEVNQIISGLNKICKANYGSVKDELVKTNISTGDDLGKIVNYVLNKMLNEVQFIDIYSELIRDLLMNGKWMIDGMTLRKVFVNRLQDMYGNVADTEFDRNFFKILYSLHKNRIVGTNLVRHVMSDLKAKFESTRDERFMEYYIVLWHTNTSYDRDYINNIKLVISKRLQFMMDDNPCGDVPASKAKKLEAPDASKYTNYIIYLDEFNGIDDMLNEVRKESNCLEFLKTLLKYTVDEPKGLDLVLKILKTGLDSKYWKVRDIRALVDNIKHNDLMEIAVDAPYYKKHLDRMLRVCGT
jgi:hypothetical protein